MAKWERKIYNGMDYRQFGTQAFRDGKTIDEVAHLLWLKFDVPESSARSIAFGLQRITKAQETQQPVVAVQPRPEVCWKNQPATEKQLDYLAKLRVRFELPLTKSQASRMIDAAREGDAALEYEDGSSTSEVY